jgi:hypothetical protein
VTAPAAAIEKVSLVEDFVDIFFAPAKVFARRATGGVWGPFLIVTILVAVLAFVNSGTMRGVMDAEVNRAVAQAMEKNPSLTEEQMSGMRGMMEMSMKWVTVVIVPIMLCVFGLCVMIVGKILGGTLGFGTGVMIASYAFVPRVLEQMLIAIQALVLDTAGYTSRWQFSLGVGRFLDPSGPQGILNTLGRLDLFTLWVTALVVLGLMHAAKVPKQKAILGGVILFVLGGVPALWQLVTGA